MKGAESAGMPCASVYAPPRRGMTRQASPRWLGIGTAGVRLHSNHPFTGAGHRRRRDAARNAGFSATVSDRALISRFPIARSRAQDGAKPER